MSRYIDADKLEEKFMQMARAEWKKPTVLNGGLESAANTIKEMPAENVIEINAFRDEVYQYIAAYKDEDANFLSGLETAVVIAEKMSGVYEELDEDECTD